ncbi:MAG: hypothetical protein KF711_00250 [Nitrospira sp.]|nr:hypothetical protein [Nitrospira sp.]
MRQLHGGTMVMIGIMLGGTVWGEAGPFLVWSAEPVLSVAATQHDQVHGALAAEGTLDRFILDPRGEVEDYSSPTGLICTSPPERRISSSTRSYRETSCGSTEGSCPMNGWFRRMP